MSLERGRSVATLIHSEYSEAVHNLMLLAFASCLMIMAFAQTQEGRSDPIDGIALPVSGAPVSLEAVGFTEDTLADGIVKTRISKGSIYRDAAGRIRNESNLPLGPQGQPFQVTRITDPVVGVQFILIVQEKVAYRLPFPKAEPPSEPRFVLILGSELVRETGGKTHKNEALGKKIIEGIEFEGSRTTTTLVAQPSRIAVDEYWISRDLGLIGLVAKSSPRGKTGVSIQNVARKEPAPSLFVVPLEYRIEDVAIPDQPK